MKFLEENITFFQAHADTPSEAIRMAGNLLAMQGYVEERYVDAMIQSFRENGPYMVIAPGIALPHARPEDGVHEACVSMLQLKEPISFGSQANDPVKLVFALGAASSSEHLECLKNLMRVLGNKETVKQLMTAASYDQVKKAVTEGMRK